ncbi:sugar-binding transcriptional regulator [Bacillus alkalicellulosilyticus]|uniref:sugar-binding transcriptional regulator n=1 Tax=Alkalihalobacterium alkalicellulosilyticum TaxID=1912214 RepID=UPI0009989346|nr:sugar-binding transcriptional regulator [Bacillus alkalicellulosilyticus]
MRVLLDVQQKLLPDMLDVMAKRFSILQYIRLMEPIGRRNLSSSLNISERVLRSEVLFLKNQGLIQISPAGMSMSDEGNAVLHSLEEVMKELLGLRTLEQQLSERLKISDVIVVAGDSDQFPWVKKEMGRACVARMKQHLSPNDVIAITGGTTIASIAEMITPDPLLKEAVFVPARGGLGEQVENQANTISAEMARRAGARYRMMHVPDLLSEEAYQSLVSEPSIKDILEIIKSACIVIHGIGEATTMAKRRGSSHGLIGKLESNHAVAEAFGYYFDQSGNIIHRERTIGLQLDDLDKSKYVIAVAGGASKADAISAYVKHRTSHVLITDEGAARSMLQK